MGIRVLVVDDSSTVRKIIQRCLQKAELGIDEVCEAGNGQEALDLLTGRTVDVVLSDINMPHMTGLQLLQAIKESPQWKRIPVFIISTEASADAVLEAVGKGAAGFIKKPFTPAEIHDQLGPVLKART
jgi:two-component system, chemotaxis family, chemotaxis protein CheY